MVADKVEVVARKAGETAGLALDLRRQGRVHRRGGREGARAARPSSCICARTRTSSSSRTRLRHIVKTYSDHIALPIVLKDDGKEETLNTAAALWTRSKSEITPEQYKEFYHHVAHSFDEPWLTIHSAPRARSNTPNLLFVPSTKPFDLFDPQRKNRVKLYVRRVFITDDCPELLPAYLRFLRGIVDSEDLPLNVSREMLQHNPVLAEHARAADQARARRAREEGGGRAGGICEVLGEFRRGAEGRHLRGLPISATRILPLVRFRSTAGDELVSLDDYVGRMKPGQEAIYYITGDALETAQEEPAARRLPGARRRGAAADRPGRRVLDPRGRPVQGPRRSNR